MAVILGIESTCDETAASVVVDGWDVHSNVIASQVELHQKYRGVVPEIASRAHIENILPVIQDALAGARCTLADIEAIAVAHRPGLIGSLLIGVTAAKTLAWALGKPLVAVDHVHAHLYSVCLKNTNDDRPLPVAATPRVAPGDATHGVAAMLATDAPDPRSPAVGLVVSGGHTSLYRIKSWTDIVLIGATIDDAVGEAYDKVAAILGLEYPGGPIIDRLAREGDPSSISFPRTMLERDSLDFSFSGLKTSVLYHVRGVPKKHASPVYVEPPTGPALNDICASFQAACVDVIVKKLRRAVAQTEASSIIVGGGVSANQGLRECLSTFELPVYFPALRYCTDNAAMSAGLAQVLFDKQRFASLDLDAVTRSVFA